MEVQLSARELALVIFLISLGMTGLNILVPALRSFDNKLPFQEAYALLGYASNFTLPGSAVCLVVSLLYNGPVLWAVEVLLLIGLSWFFVRELDKDTAPVWIS